MQTQPPTLTKSKILLLAIATGIVVANLNYIQPLLGLIASDMHTTQHVVGVVAMMTQLGYAFGLLLLVPLGDIFDRNHLIQVMLVLAIVGLLAAYFAPQYCLIRNCFTHHWINLGGATDDYSLRSLSELWSEPGTSTRQCDERPTDKYFTFAQSFRLDCERLPLADSLSGRSNYDRYSVDYFTLSAAP